VTKRRAEGAVQHYGAAERGGCEWRQVGISDDFDNPKSSTSSRSTSARGLLLPIAEAMGDLICQKDFTFVRKCEGPTCTLWFLDVSKGHGRRWCSMAACGNRAKVAAHRTRVRGCRGPA